MTPFAEDRPLEARVDELESRLAWADDTLATLGAEIARQQRVIDALEVKLRALTDRIATADEPVFRGTARDEIPPHW
ncbi:SlyX family protein [Nevskia sp.]|uniref:SlyX family protein n=1 Tax=Nevskia sp. TaxID=1929292 RepID=UPI0025E0AD8B|nr:SlyX family protein [Nevskia sp.]